MDNVIINVIEISDNIDIDSLEVIENIDVNITEIPDDIQINTTEIPENINVDITELCDNIQVNVSSNAIWGMITGTLSNQTDLQAALDSKQNLLGFTPANELIEINGAGLLAGQGGNLTANRTFTINNIDINHNSIFNTHNLTTDIDHLSINNIGVNTHVQIDSHIADSTIHFTAGSLNLPTTYLKLDCSNGPLTGTLKSQSIKPNLDTSYDLGDSSNFFRTIYLNNNTGKVIDCKTAIGTTARTDYTFDLGGGGNVATEGGDFTFQMDPCVGACENNIVFDVGNVYWAGAGFFNRFRIQSYTGLRTYAFTSEFGGFNNPTYGWTLEYVSGLANTHKTLFFDNKSASGINRSIDFRIDGDNKLTIENNNSVQVIYSLATPELTATVINNGVQFGSVAVPGVNFKAYGNFFGLNWFDYLTVNAVTSNLPVCLGMFPSGVATNSYVNTYNSSNTGATAWLQMGVRGSIAELVVRDFAQTTNITTLNIGSGGNDFPLFDVTCNTLTDINFVFAGVTYYNFTSSLLTFSDAVNIAFNTVTGTKIGTATNQKLGFFNATPVTQRQKANYNNWASYTDIIDALVDLGLFDQA
jgi:hypothetical protein